MFLSLGYTGVSVEGLIGRVGGSRRNVYGPYGGKAGLFVEAVRSICQEIGSQLDALPMTDSALQPGLALYGRRLLQLLLQPRMLAMHRLMVAEGERFPEAARSLCATGRDRAAAELGSWLAGHQAAGALRADLPAQALAHHFIHLVVDGPQLRALVGEIRPGWSAAGIGQHVDHAVDLFLHGVGTPTGATPAAPEHPERSASPPPSPRRTRP